MRPRLAVTGLGKVGCRYDLAPEGNLGRSHVGAALLSPDVELCGGADPDPKARMDFTALTGLPAFTRTEDLLAQARPDIVCVCTPPDRHHAACRQALEAGVRALVCEKPFMGETSLARDILAEARKLDAVVAVNHWMRYSPPYEDIRGLLARGGLGRPLQVRYLYAKGARNSGTHAFDLLRFLFGEVQWVRASRVTPLPGGDDNIDGEAGLAGGLTVDLRTVDYRCHFTTELDILAEQGRVTLGDRTLYFTVRQDDSWGFPRRLLTRQEPPFASEQTMPPLVALFRDVADCLARRSSTPRCSGRDGLAALLCVDALRRSAALGGVAQPVMEE